MPKGKMRAEVSVKDKKTGKMKKLKGISKVLTDSINKKDKEVVCTVCGVVAKSRLDYCEHLLLKYPPTNLFGESSELPGMPPKTEEVILAEQILDLKDIIKGNQEELSILKSKLINLMRLIQKSWLLVKGWQFDVELEDKLSIKKKK